MRKIFTLIMAMLLILPTAFLLSGCGETKVSLTLTISQNLSQYIKTVEFANSSATRESEESLVFTGEAKNYNKSTANFTISFVNGYEPESVNLTVASNSFTDYTIKANEQNKFVKQIEFSLPCEKNSKFEIALGASDVKPIDKAYTINLKVPVDEQESYITTDFAGAEYLKEISILAYKDSEQTPNYYTLEDIFQENTAEEQKSTFKAYMVIEKPFNMYLPLFFVKAPFKYVNDFNLNGYHPGKNSVISKMFKVGEHDIYLDTAWYRDFNTRESEIASGNIKLSLEDDYLISNEDVLTIDPTVLTQDFSKSFYINPLNSSEFTSVTWQNRATNYHYYGSDQTITFSPNVAINQKKYSKENIDLSDAQVFVNGVEITSVTKNLQSDIHTISFKLGKLDTSNMVNGQPVKDSTGKLNVEITNIKLKNITNGHFFEIELPHWEKDFTNPLYSTSVSVNKEIVGTVRHGETVKFFCVTTKELADSYDREFRIKVHEFGYQTFKIKATDASGNVYISDLFDVLTAEYDATIPLFDSASGEENTFVRINYYNDYIYIRLDAPNEFKKTAWETSSGYKFEFVNTTRLPEETQFNFEFEPEVTSFTVNGEEQEYSNNFTIHAGDVYSFNGTVYNSTITQDKEYSISYKYCDAEGNELEEIYDYNVLIWVTGTGVHPITTNGELSFNLRVEIGSRCQFAKYPSQYTRATIGRIAKVVFYLNCFD